MTAVPPHAGDRIRRLRVARGLSQIQLGALLGVSNVTVNRWERGRVRPTAASWQRFLRLEREVAGGGLPTPLTSFVGRSRERAAVVRLIDETRLLALTGPGGCGKTRLAIAVAHQVGERFPDGVWWVDLAALLDPELVPEVVARALGANQPVARPPVDRLAAACRGRRLLLILDNCEHVLGACAALLATLLAAAPEIRVLTTSRAPLDLPGETIWPVPPLSLPSREGKHEAGRRGGGEAGRRGVAPELLDSSTSRLLDSDAVQLFVERARARRPGFTPTERTLPLIEEVCRELDGLPLAIELAAARAAVLSVEQIAERLVDRFRLLRDARDRPTVPPRQQALSAAFDWSYDLLTEPERILFARLAIFPGHFDLDAAEHVAGEGGCAGGLTRGGWRRGAGIRPQGGLAGGGDGGAHRSPHAGLDLPPASAPLRSPPAQPPSVLDLLDRLVAQSLVVAEPPADEAGPMRYRLLATLRAYGRERLDAAGETGAVADRHAAYFLDLAERAVPALHGAAQANWLDRLEREHDNLRAALARLIERGDAAGAVRLGVALERFWSVRGYCAEGHAWLERVLALLPDEPSAERASANLTAGAFAHPLGRYEEAIARFETALTDWRALGDRRGEAAALDALGAMARRQGDFARAVALHETALALFRALGDEAGILESLITLGTAAAFKTDYDLAERCFHEGLALAHRRGDRLAEKTLWNDLGDLAQRRGEPAAAIEPFERSLAVARELGNRDGIAAALVNLAEVRAGFGEVERAIGLVAEGVQLLREGGNRAFLAAALYVLGRILSARGEHERALATMREALTGYQRLGDASGVAHSLEALAWLAIDAGDAAAGARWLGAAAAAREALDIPTYDAAAQARAVALAGAALGETAFGENFAAGRSLPLDEAIGDALARPPRRPEPVAAIGARSPVAQALTARQREVLALVAAGRSNREIADALGVSPRTIDHHLTAIYAALGVERRAGAIAYALANGLVELAEPVDALSLPVGTRRTV